MGIQCSKNTKQHQKFMTNKEQISPENKSKGVIETYQN